MKTVENADGSLSPDVPRPIRRLVGFALRVAWRCIPARALVNACCYSNGCAADRVVLWIHGNWAFWDCDCEGRDAQ